MDCYACARNDSLESLPTRELIGIDAYWRVAHAFDTALPGWLVLIPRRHVTAVADLTDAESAGLGAWQVRLSRALHAETGCAKTYVIQFAEQEGFSHVHFHVVPRYADQPADRRGPRVFGYLGAPPESRVADARLDALAGALASRLSRTR